MQKPVMTLNEVMDDLRSLGVKISPTTLSDGIASGLYPFGNVLHVGETGRRHIQIFRTEYERWKAEVLFGKYADPNTSPPISTANWELISTRSYTQEDKDIMWEVIIRSWSRKQQSAALPSD